MPCEYVRAVQQRKASTPSDRSRFGVSHPSVVATGTADKPVCHLAPGTWRPGGPDQCYHNRIMSQFDYDDWLRSDDFPRAHRGARAASLPLPDFPIEPPEGAGGPGGYEQAPLDVSKLRTLCEAAAKHADTPLLQLDGLIPIRDLLVDAPIGAAEFASEQARLASGRPRWRSLLQSKQLRELEDVCPGAKTLLMQRKACVGYFLAE